MRAGVRVTWGYLHSLGRNYTKRVKHGSFVRMIKQPEWMKGKGYPRWCLVHFDGNKNPSRVRFSELVKEWRGDDE